MASSKGQAPANKAPKKVFQSPQKGGVSGKPSCSIGNKYFGRPFSSICLSPGEKIMPVEIDPLYNQQGKMNKKKKKVYFFPSRSLSKPPLPPGAEVPQRLVALHPRPVLLAEKMDTAVHSSGRTGSVMTWPTFCLKPRLGPPVERLE